MKPIALTQGPVPEHLKRPEGVVAVAGLDPFQEAPDTHLLLVDASDQVLACASVWHRQTPALSDERLGFIGHYFATDARSSDALLREATDYLQDQSCTLAIGPLNGNTWRKYRFVTESNGEPPILFEPSNPSAWPEYWEGFGFEPLAGYHSSIFDDLSIGDERTTRGEQRLSANGISIRSLDLDNYLAELRRIYKVSAASFVSNFLYTPISESDFVKLYEPVRRFVDPRFCLIAEQGDQPVGFIFSIPDLSQQTRGQAVDTLIVKTLAVLPHRQNAGLGAVLVERMRQPAQAAGMRRIIHALMHDHNTSANIGKGRSKILRRYTLYSKRLSS